MVLLDPALLRLLLLSLLLLLLPALLALSSPCGPVKAGCELLFQTSSCWKICQSGKFRGGKNRRVATAQLLLCFFFLLALQWLKMMD